METLVENLAITDAEEAMSNAMIDALIYEKDFEKTLKAALGLNMDQSINSVEFYEMNTQIKSYDNETKDRIAVIYANGQFFTLMDQRKSLEK